MGKQSVKTKAIVVGNLVDVVGTMVATILLGIVGLLIKKAAAQDSIWSYLAGHLVPSGDGSRPFLFAVGIFFSIFGGFVAARMAKEKELLYGGLSTILCLLLGVYSMITAHEIGLKSLFSKALTIALGVLGGYIQMKVKNRRSAEFPRHDR
jgi:hypothetical protein